MPVEQSEKEGQHPSMLPFARQKYSGCKPAIGDLLLGAAALAAEVNNVDKVPQQT